MVTGEQVKQATLGAGIIYIPHHNCSICGEWVAYIVQDGNLYFSPACGCSWSPADPRTWDSAADWINMQSSEEWRNKIMSKFGFAPNNASTPPASAVGTDGESDER